MRGGPKGRLRKIKKRAQMKQNVVSSCWYTLEDLDIQCVRLAEVVHSAFESSPCNFLLHQTSLNFRYAGNVPLYPKLFPEASSQR